MTQTVNKWIVGETARARETADAALETYRFNDYANGLYAHVWGVFCDWYLEFAKPLLQGEDAAAKAETQRTAAWALDQILLLLHPVTPFITEALWEQTAGDDAREKRLVHGDWPNYAAADLADAGADQELGWLVKLIETIRSVRAEMNVPPGAEIDLLLLDAAPEVSPRLERNGRPRPPPRPPLRLAHDLRRPERRRHRPNRRHHALPAACRRYRRQRRKGAADQGAGEGGEGREGDRRQARQ